MLPIVFVKKTVRRRGDKSYTYLSLVEAERVDGKNTHRTLLRLGEVSELRDSGQLDRIIAALRRFAEETWLTESELEAEDAPAFGAVAAIRTVWERLDLDTFFAEVGARRRARRLADTAFVMAANRLCDPASKRRTVLEWCNGDVALPAGIVAPSVDQCYRALDAVADAKDEIETHLYARLTDLANLDLRLVCYDLTSTYWETDPAKASERFPSRMLGYSRDHRGDRPQIVIGLLVTGDGIPIAHHVFAGNTADSTTLPGVLADLQDRFGVGGIALVADRGLISEDNLKALGDAGFDHVLATRLHHTNDVKAVLEAAADTGRRWVRIDEGTRAVEIGHDSKRYVVVDSQARRRRDDARREDLLARTEDALIALEDRVRGGRLSDPAKIGAAADRILRDSGVGRCFKMTTAKASFAWDYDHDALDYEERLLAGRYVLTTSLSPEQASAGEIVRHYRSLESVERRFRVLKDFLALRPVYHWTEHRVRGHVAICVLAATLEALIGQALSKAGIADPDLPEQTMSARRALRELGRIRRHTIIADAHTLELVSRRRPLQARILTALDVDTHTWDKATIA